MSSLNLNRAVLAGHLTSDVELKVSTSGISVCSFTIAVKRRGSSPDRPVTDFISCVAWRQTAEFVSRYFKKGSAICVVGAIQTRSWQDAQGNRRYATEVIVDEAMFVDSKTENTAPAGAESGTKSSAVPSAIDTISSSSFEDDDVPF